jgi:hypothetical protein
MKNLLNENNDMFDQYKQTILNEIATSGTYHDVGTTYGPDDYGSDPDTGIAYGGGPGHPPGFDETRYIGVVDNVDTEAFHPYLEEFPEVLIGGEDEWHVYLPTNQFSEEQAKAFSQTFRNHPLMRNAVTLEIDPNNDDPGYVDPDDILTAIKQSLEQVIQ